MSASLKIKFLIETTNTTSLVEVFKTAPHLSLFASISLIGVVEKKEA
jgi:hypothetical protein